MPRKTLNLDTLSDSLHDAGFTIRPRMRKVGLDISKNGWAASIDEEGTVFYSAEQDNLRTIKDAITSQDITPIIQSYAEEKTNEP